MKCIKIFVSVLLFLLPLYVYGSAITAPQVIPRYKMDRFNQVIQTLYDSVPDSRSDNIVKRVAADSEFFLGRPYYNGPLGEGPNGESDKSPLYRTDKFDCMTFVSTILALAEATTLKQFQINVNKVRYKNGTVSYLNRNHFVSVDWNKNNTRNGFLRDITDRIVDRNGRSVAAIAATIINKPGWYKKLDASNIKTFKQLSSARAKKLLNELHQLARQTRQERSVMLYLPLRRLFKADGQPNIYLFKQIPSGSVIEIIRPDWDLHSQIGTRMNVSHLGLAVRTSKGLMFREASSLDTIGKTVIDVPLTNYLKGYLHSPTVKGINVQKIILLHKMV